MTAPAAPIVVRHDLGRTVAVVGWVGAVAALLTGGPPGLAGWLAAAGISGVVWVLCWRPAVVVDDDAVTVRNPFRDVRIGWAALDEATFDWSLRLRAGALTCRAAAAPGPASMGALYDRRSTPGGIERRAVAEAGRRLPAALLVVRQRWAARAHETGGELLVTRPWPSIIVLSVSVVVLVLAALDGRA